MPDVEAVAPPVASPSQPVSLVTIIPVSAPAAQETTDLINTLNGGAIQTAAGAGTTVYVTGTTAVGSELAEKVAQRLPWFIGLVILISFILLMIEFRSLLVPLQAAIMNRYKDLACWRHARRRVVARAASAAAPGDVGAWTEHDQPMAMPTATARRARCGPDALTGSVPSPITA